jgi:DnaJ family protein A protein 5
MATFEVPEWAQARSDDNGAEGEFTESEEESEVEVLECVVCNKTFKSEKQLEAHEKSKKHIKALQQLRWQMKREGADLQLDEVPSLTHEGANKCKAQNDVTQEENTDGQRSTNLAQSMTISPSPGDVSPKAAPADSADASDDTDYAPRDVVEERISSASKDNIDEETVLSASVNDISVDEPAKKKIGKAKAKRAKKAAAAQTQQDESVC